MNAWSAILLSVAAVVVFWTTWRGWRAGVVRQLVSLAALVLCGVLAISGGRVASPVLSTIGLPERWTFIGSIALAIVVYAVITGASWLLLKKTGHQEVGPVRFTYGLFGAIIGLLKGLLVVWVAAIGIRFAGGIVELQTELSDQTPSSLLRAPQGALGPAGRGDGLVEMSRALDQGIVGETLDLLDPVPAPLRQNTARLMHVVADHKAMARFRSYPGVRDLANHPKIFALGADREFQRAAADGNLLALAQNPRMQEVISDERIISTLQQIDLTKALDYALPEKPRRSPSEVRTSRPSRAAP